MAKNDTTTTTQKTEYPQWVEEAQKALGTTGLGMVAPYLQSPQYARAGMTEDQMMAGNLARQSANRAFDSNYAGQIAGAGGGYTPTTVSGADIQAQMSPYLETVGRTVLNDMGREKDNANAAIGARNANAVSFGGSGAALERAQLERGHGQNVGRAISEIQNAGWDRASNLAMSNAAAQNSAGQFSSQQGLAALLGANTAEHDAFSREQSALATLLGYGNRTQSEAQANLDIPWMQLQRGMSLIPGVGGTTVSTAPDTSPGFLQQLLGAGLAVGGMGVSGGGSLAGNWLSGLMK